MPVLFNTQTGEHENLPQQDADAALKAGTHELPVVGSDGDFGSVAPGDFQAATKQGYRQPSSEELQKLLTKTKREKPAEIAKTAAEGALSGATFGLGNDLEAAVAGNSKDQLERREVNPGTHAVGQMAGLVGSSLTGVGEGAALEALGAKLAPKATTALGRVGSAATKAAIENMAFQAGDDATQAFLGDPHVTATHFITDVGLSGVLGAAIGGAGRGTAELWNLGPGAKLGAMLDKIKARTEPTLSQRFQAIADNTAGNINQQTAHAANTVSDNMGTVGQGIVDNAAAGDAANVNATNGVGQAVTDAANMGADNAGAIGQAQIDAINSNGKATVDAINNLANQQNQTLSLADRLRVGNAASESANVDALKMVGSQGAEGPDAKLLETAGLSADQVPDTLKAALGDNADTRMKHSLLQSGTSKAAQEVQKDVDAFRGTLQDKAAEAVGLTPETVEHVNDVSEHTTGKEAGKHLQQGFKDAIETGTEGFEEFHDTAKNVPLDTQTQMSLANRLVEAGQEQGWVKSPSSDEARLLKRILTELPLQENVSDLAKYTTLINSETERAELWNAGSTLRKIFREEADQAIQRHLAETGGAEVAARFAQTRKNYGALMDFLETYGKRLGINSFAGPAEFMSKLGDLAKNPEKLLARLSVEGDESLSQMLAHQMPEAYKLVNEFNRAELVKKALTADRKAIDLLKLGKQVDKLSPEFRARILPDGAPDRINALETLQRQIPERQNKSGTGGFIMNAINNMSASAVGMGATMATGPVGGATAFVLKKMADYVGKEVPDAITLATLKSLGSNMPTNPMAFKQMAAVASAVIRGEAVLGKAVKAVFSGATRVISEPSHKDIEKLKKQIDEASQAPDKMLNVGGDLGHYMPEAGTALGETSAQAVQYLAALRPVEAPLGPLDNNRVPSKTEKASYERALRIAQQPLVVMNDIRSGRLAPADIGHLKALYPGMHQHIANKLMSEIVNAKSANKTIPYSTKLGLSHFLGQPMEASLRQPNIAANQMAISSGTMGNAQQAPQQGKPARANPHLQDLASAYATPQQSRAQSRHGRP